MDIEEFVRESLVQIVKGVQAVNVELKSDSDTLTRSHFEIPLGEQKERTSGRIEFDVAVTTKIDGKGSVGAKLKLRSRRS